MTDSISDPKLIDALTTFFKANDADIVFLNGKYDNAGQLTSKFDTKAKAKKTDNVIVLVGWTYDVGIVNHLTFGLDIGSLYQHTSLWFYHIRTGRLDSFANFIERFSEGFIKSNSSLFDLMIDRNPVPLWMMDWVTKGRYPISSIQPLADISLRFGMEIEGVIGKENAVIFKSDFC